MATLRWSERRLRVLIASDAFKGSLDAATACLAIATGWRRHRPHDQLDLCPLADGGDGFGPVLAHRLGAEPHACDTVDAAGRPRRARWWLAPAPRQPLAVGQLNAMQLNAMQLNALQLPVASASAPASIAIVESAEAIGLALLPPALRHPLPLDAEDWQAQYPDSGSLERQALAAMPPDRLARIEADGEGLAGDQPRVDCHPLAHAGRDDPGHDNSGHDSWSRDNRGLDSRGLAPLLLAAGQAGAGLLLLGLGGSATNDGGFGLAQALGWRFFAADGAAIRRWGDLWRLERLEPPPRSAPLPPLLIAVDVRNPLLGPEGASAIYGPQKGLTAQQLPQAEACLRRLADCLEARFPGVAERPGSGAAGGLGYGLQVFCGGQLRPGEELVAELCELEARVEAADLVIGGEGRFDRQSLMGKGTGRLLRRAQRAGRPGLLLVGQLQEEALQRARAEAALQGCAVAALAVVPDLTDLAQAEAAPALWLERLAERAASDLDALSPAAAP